MVQLQEESAAIATEIIDRVEYKGKTRLFTIRYAHDDGLGALIIGIRHFAQTHPLT